jgi:hypothetical protein
MIDISKSVHIKGPPHKEINRYAYPKQLFASWALFGARWSELEGISLSQSLRHKTEAYYFLSNNKPNQIKCDPYWERMKTKLDNAETLGEVTNILWKRYLHTEFAQFNLNNYSKENGDYGGFSFDKSASTETVSVHFVNARRSLLSTLSPYYFEETIKHLKNMFENIKRKFPEVKSVNGESWTYNLSNYRKLFPESYTANMETVTPNEQNIYLESLWGQFIDRYGQGRMRVIREFEENVRKSQSTDELLHAFPYSIIRVQDKIQKFYDFYGIK